MVTRRIGSEHLRLTLEHRRYRCGIVRGRRRAANRA
jgi:hypothetical protein